MAELNLKQITDKLNSEFASDVRKLVFWYDANAEFQEDIDSIELENVDTGSKTMVPCDLVVLSLGVRPENGLYESIKSSFSRVYNIGDSNKIGRIHNATEAAYQLAMSL